MSYFSTITEFDGTENSSVYNYYYTIFELVQILFFQAVAMSVLMYGCTTWTLIKGLEKMQHAVLNKSLKQHSTKWQLYGHLHPILQSI